MIDLNQKVHEPEIENLVDKCQNVTITGKELPKLDVGPKVIYKKNSDASKNKHPQWLKGKFKDRK